MLKSNHNPMKTETENRFDPVKSKLKLSVVIMIALHIAFQLGAQPAPQFVPIHVFGGINTVPSAALTLGQNGHIYGTTFGGAYADGTGSIFVLVPNGDGTFTCSTLNRLDTAYSPANDGQNPDARLTLSRDGTILFGTTQKGGSGGGVVFSVNIEQSEAAVFNSGSPQPNGSSQGYSLLYPFNTATDGGAPKAALVALDNGAAPPILFGTLSAEGPSGGGSVFSIFSFPNAGSLSYLGFHVGELDEKPPVKYQALLLASAAAQPKVGGLAGKMPKTPVKANDATNIDLSTIAIYGISKSGGSNNWGTVYSVNANGSNFMVLHHFSLSTTDGAGPMGGMVLSCNTLYGTTPLGGNNFAGTVFQINTDGSGFQIIKNFDFATTGYSPEGDLILSGSTLYGTTHAGGVNGGGTVFSINTSGSNFMVLHSFTTPVSDGNGHYTNSDGGLSVAGLLLSGYTLYGTTPYGGTNGVGTAYEILLPAPPSLNIAKSGGSYKISWLASATNFVLQQNSNLATTNWSTNSLAISNDGTNKSVTIIPAAGSAYFRLMSTNGP